MSNEHLLKAALAEHQEEQRRKQRGLMSDTYNLDCSRFPPIMDPITNRPTYTPKPDNGDRNRRSDAKVSDPVNKKHGHYFKDVSSLTEIDVYAVCDLFQVKDCSGATQHAIKKLLLPGQRGAGKDVMKDLQEAVDTLNRKIEMMKENAK